MTKLKHPDIVRFEEEMAKAEGLPAGQLHCVVLHVSPILGSFILANCNYGNRRIRRIAVAQWRARLREGRRLPHSTEANEIGEGDGTGRIGEGLALQVTRWEGRAS